MAESDVATEIGRGPYPFTPSTSPLVTGPLRVQEERANALNAPEPVGFWSGLSAGWTVPTTGRLMDQAYQSITALPMMPDPNFTIERHAELIDKASLTLQKDFMSKLYRAQSEEEFNFYLERATALQQSYQELARSNNTIVQLNSILAHLVDPVSWGVGWGSTVGILSGLYKASQAGKIAVSPGINVILGAAAGAGGGLTQEALYDALGGLSDEESYVLSGILGAALGGAFGPYAVRRAGEWAAIRRGIFDKLKPGAKATGLTAAAKKAKEYFSKLRPTDPPPPVPEVPTAAPRPTETVQEGVPPLATVEIGDTRIEVGQDTIDQVTEAITGQPPRTTAAATTPDVDIQAPPPRRADLVQQLADLEQDMRNLRYAGRFKAADQEYKIRSDLEGGAPPYKVLKKTTDGKWRTIKGEYPTIEEAKLAILTDSGAAYRGFRTAKGSVYNIEGTSTVRDKAPRPEHPGEQGVQPKSERTFYVPLREAEKLAPIQAKGPQKYRLVTEQRNGETFAAIRQEDGKILKGTEIKVSDVPKLGDIPVEIFRKGRFAHFGNEITQLFEDLPIKQGAGPSVGAAVTPGPRGKDILDFLPKEIEEFFFWSKGNLKRYSNIFLRHQYTRQGLLQNNPNDFVSYIASYLSNNPIGMPDGSAIPISVETIAEKGKAAFGIKVRSGLDPIFEDFAKRHNISWSKYPETRENFMVQAGRRLRETDRDGTAPNYDPDVIKAADHIESVFKEYPKRFKEAGFEWAQEIEDLPNYLTRAYEAGYINHATRELGLNVHSLDPKDPAMGMELIFTNAMKSEHDRAFARELKHLTEKGQEGSIVHNADGSKHIDLPDGTRHVLRLSEHQIRIKARAYVSNIVRRSMGLGDDLEYIVLQGDRELLRTRLRESLEESQMLPSNTDLDAITDYIMPSAFKGKKFFADFTHRRSLVDENIPTIINGREFRVKDFLDNNVERLALRYGSRAEGMLALAKLQIPNPATGNMLVDGIRSRTDWDNFIIGPAKQAGVFQGADINRQTAGTILGQDTIDQLNWMYNRYLGIPEKHYQGNIARYVRWNRQFQAGRLMSNVGVAQGGETGTPIGVLGWKAFVKHFKPHKAFGIDPVARSAAQPKLVTGNPLYRQLEALIGIAPARQHGGYYNIMNIQDGTDMPFQWVSNQAKNPMPFAAKIDVLLHNLEEFTYKFSGMRFIQYIQQMFAVNGMSEFIAQGVELGDKSLRKRLRSYGIDDTTPNIPKGTKIPKGVKGRVMSMSMLDRIQYELVNNVEWPLNYAGNKQGSLRLDKWEDLEAKFVWEHSMNIMSRRLIQSGSPSHAAIFMDGPVGRTIFMFRSFMLTAYSNQFLHNLHMGDWRSIATAAYTMGIAGLLRVGQVYGQSINRADREEFLDKNLSIGAIGSAAFQRSGWASIFPMVFDTVSPYEAFSYRLSGQPSDIIFGNPTLDFADRASKGAKGIAKSLIEGRSMTQAEAKALISTTIPWSNFFAFQNAMSIIIDDLPKRAPKQEDTPIRDLWNERVF